VFTTEELEHPYPFYEHLREAATVHRVDGTRIVLVARHADVLEVLGRTDDFSNRIQDVLYTVRPEDETGASEGAAADVLATADDPDHALHRHLVATAFTSRRIASLEPEIVRLVDHFLEHGLATGRIEWMAGVALPLPLAVVCSLLDVPAEDLARLQRWTDAGVEVLGGLAPPGRMEECSRLIADWTAYHLIQLRAACASLPDDPGPEGVVATLARSTVDQQLGEHEAASIIGQLPVAGSESTSSLLGSAVALLARDGELQNRLRADPSLLPVFLEETLRLEAPFRGHYRQVVRDTELRGVALQRGDRLFILWSSANRDPLVFTRPDEPVLDREGLRQHLSFGLGLHFCIGAPLARLEARVALERLLASTRRFTGPAEPRHVPNLMVRRIASLPLAVEAA
jgi:cytochrome P450 family 144